MIDIRNLSKSYGETRALDGLTLSVEAGEVMGFLGPNGSGKTTTIRLLMGLLRPTTGTASILGRDCFADATELKRSIGYLPDEPFLYPYLSAQELLSLVAGLHGFSGADLGRRVGGALERFGLGGEARGYVVTFSHGMKKRLALAAATIHDPRVLILDEPTNGLDPRGARDMRALVSELAAEGRTVFLSTHLLEAAERLCHRVAIVTKGQLRVVGAPGELRAQHRASSDRKGVQDPSLEDLFLAVTEA